MCRLCGTSHLQRDIGYYLANRLDSSVCCAPTLLEPPGSEQRFTGLSLRLRQGSNKYRSSYRLLIMSVHSPRIKDLRDELDWVKQPRIPQ